MVYRNLQTEEYMRSLPDPGSILGFREALAPVRISDEFPTNVDGLWRFVENHDSIDRREELDDEIG